jgi:hypothetical protein
MTSSKDLQTKYQSGILNSSIKSGRSQSQVNVNDFYLTRLMSLRNEKQTELLKSQNLGISSSISKPKKTKEQIIGEAITLTQADSRRENKFFNRLIGTMKAFYGSRQAFVTLFEKLDTAFEVQVKVRDQVACYKPELGVLMQESVRDLYEVSMELLSATKKEIDIAGKLNELKLKVNTEKMNEMETQRTSLQALLTNYEHLIWAKNTEVDKC